MKTSLLNLLQQISRRNRNNEMFKMAVTLAVVTLLGVGVAAAAISMGPLQNMDPAMRPLSWAPALTVAPAFGVDDEDCTLATRRIVLPNGHVGIHRELVCEQ
jgi:hypothetical protein